MARWRALGFDGALVGEALVRAGDPAAAARAFVAAGAAPDDPANVARRPFVKICGVTDEDGVLAAVAAGADAIGLNVVPGTPRALALDEAARSRGWPARRRRRRRRPLVVAITADATAGRSSTRSSAAVDPDVVQLNGGEPVEASAASGAGRGRSSTCRPRRPANLAVGRRRLVSRGRAYLDAGRRAAPARHGRRPASGRDGDRAPRAAWPPRSRGSCRSPWPAASVRANVADALRAIPAVGVDVASGVERPARPGARPTKDPFRVALFVKRARAARDDRPNLPFGPTPGPRRPARRRRRRPMGDGARLRRPVRPGDADGRPRAARGRLRRAPPGPGLLGRAARAAGDLRRPPDRRSTAPIAWPTPSARRRRGSPRLARAPPRSRRLRLYLKREDLAHTGAHKINNALGQALLTRRLGKTRVIAETGAGQHGVATATACALLDLPCVVYMGAEDIERQGPNVLRMRALGAEVRSVTSGTATLKDAVNEAMRDWVTNVETTHYVLGSAMGPHPYPTIVRDLQRRIGDEAAAQLVAVEGRLPDLALACVGGGSNAIGLLARFIGEPSVRLAVVEAAGDGIETGRHAAAILGGTPGILHGSRSLMLQDARRPGHRGALGVGRPRLPGHRAAAGGARRGRPDRGRRRHGPRGGGGDEGDAPGPRGSCRRSRRRTRSRPCPKLLAGVGGVGGAWPDEVLVLLGFSGRGDKDLAALERFADVEPWADARR